MPIRGKIKDPEKELTLANIHKHISDYDIFRYFSAKKFYLGETIPSPFRIDKSPSFTIRQSRDSGAIYWLDYKTGETGNAVQFVSRVFGLNFNEALERISSAFCLGLGEGNVKNELVYKRIIESYEQPDLVIPTCKRIDVFPRKFTGEEAKYWAKRYLSEEECNKGEIYGIRQLYIDGSRITNPGNELRFAYYFPEVDKWKIYAPNADKAKGEKKWRTNLGIYVEGLNSLKKEEISIIQKSRKDRIITSKYISTCLNTQNESECSIPEEDRLTILNNSKESYIFWDNDSTGISSCTSYNKKGFKYINIPKSLGAKDVDELVVKYGLNALEDFLKSRKLIS